ncbi:hypothetical protein ACMU_13250 [Actibacterium mucosum KCTC 23349]|uniref:SF4 helicase domain-containing protein n=1 Tax=Actibacterium mucosum KCTC 23349 TaxID=1454373 RepID=A0A037ZJB6_9RHOB|nr:DNA helicase [Actibacterium mucosum]KAJ55652.1 hypothetical protein ACMU_13250 [Actibacterium mucosum KCTC 23349]
MSLSSPIFALKREARQIGRRQNMPLHAALNAVARREGYRSWSHLSDNQKATDPLWTLLNTTGDGGLFLLGGRPGHGKTLLALRLLDQAARNSGNATFFTLDYSVPQVSNRLEPLGLATPPRFDMDVSDNITAAYVAEQMDAQGGPSVGVIDYLQVLDQNRSTPPLANQVRELANHVARTRDTIVVLSQVDRQFDAKNSTMPTPEDIRQPNPFDLQAFDAIVLLHNDQVQVFKQG